MSTVVPNHARLGWVLLCVALWGLRTLTTQCMVGVGGVRLLQQYMTRFADRPAGGVLCCMHVYAACLTYSQCCIVYLF
jgi:hypothetical protein